MQPVSLRLSPRKVTGSKEGYGRRKLALCRRAMIPQALPGDLAGGCPSATTRARDLCWADGRSVCLLGLTRAEAGVGYSSLQQLVIPLVQQLAPISNADAPMAPDVSAPAVPNHDALAIPSDDTLAAPHDDVPAYPRVSRSGTFGRWWSSDSRC